MFNNTTTFQTTQVVSSQRRLLRRMMRVLIAIAFKLLTKMEIIGRENLPQKGPLLLVGNHFHFADPLAFIHIAPAEIEFMGNRQMPNAPKTMHIFPFLWKTFNVNRGASSRDALMAAKRYLDSGGILGIFPEAGSWAQVLRPARPGTALLALRTGAPLIPVGLDGFNDIFPSLRKGKRARVTIRIGKPFGPYSGNVTGRGQREMMDEVGHDIMRHITPLIPAEKHGYYSDDPHVRAEAEAASEYPWDVK